MTNQQQRGAMNELGKAWEGVLDLMGPKAIYNEGSVHVRYHETWFFFVVRRDEWVESSWVEVYVKTPYGGGQRLDPLDFHSYELLAMGPLWDVNAFDACESAPLDRTDVRLHTLRAYTRTLAASCVGRKYLHVYGLSPEYVWETYYG